MFNRSKSRPGAQELEALLAENLDTNVKLNIKKNDQGMLTIEFLDLADLERIYRLIIKENNAHQI